MDDTWGYSWYSYFRTPHISGHLHMFFYSCTLDDAATIEICGIILAVYEIFI